MSIASSITVYRKNWNAAFRITLYWVQWKSGTKEKVVPDFHATQCGLLRNPTATQWKSGTILQNTYELSPNI